MKYEIKLMILGISVIGFLMFLFMFGLGSIGGMDLIEEYDGFITFMILLMSGGLAFNIVFKPFGYQKEKESNQSSTTQEEILLKHITCMQPMIVSDKQLRADGNTHYWCPTCKRYGIGYNSNQD